MSEPTKSKPRAKQAVIDEEYFQATLGTPLNEIYFHLEPHLPETGFAIDLGCGVGKATLFLLEKGWEVLAVDISPRAIEILKNRAGGHPGLRTTVADMGELPLPKCDLVSAGFSLFFLDQEGLRQVWPRIVRALRPGGLFVGQFLGVRDEWSANGHALVDAAMLRGMLAKFELIRFEEFEGEGVTSKGNPKHWHVFHVIARKRGQG